MAEDDDEFFCPRLRWAYENGEDLSLILMEKEFHEMDLKVLDFLEKNPNQTALAIYKALNIDQRKVHRHIQSLRKKQVKIEGFREKTGGRMTYRVLSRPKTLHFFYRTGK